MEVSNLKDSGILILMKNSNKQKPTFIQDRKQIKVKEVHTKGNA